ncbi:MAG: type VI secretion system contractile sheath large subunit [Bacteroidota bacterium]
MPEAQAQDAAQTETTEAGSLLDSILSQVDVARPSAAVSVETFTDATVIADNKQDAIAAALRVFVDAVADQPIDRIDKHLLNGLVAQLDEKISRQLDVVLHHPDFQKLESSWKGLKFLLDRTDFKQGNVNIEIMNVSKDDLQESFEDSPELIQSALYQKVYTEAYDTPGASPYSSIIANYEFDASPPDVALLQNASKVAAAAHCPFISSVGPKFFGVDSMEEWRKIPDLAAYLETADYIKWNSFRDSEDSRYVGLTFPRFMLRLPYGPDTVPVKSFNYKEQVTGADHDKYLWGNAAFSFAANMVQAFAKDGWSVQIRGPQSGGKVEDLPVHVYDVGKGAQTKIPTEVPISETLEFECANLGFMPLSVYQNTDYACFFSANSAQRPKEYDDPNATANSRINSRLPYILLAARIAHYLKVLQRENIGATKDKTAIQKELNTWLGGLVTEMTNPSPSVVAKYPLRKGEVVVEDVEDNPGFFRIKTLLMPHFQIEGMDISLSLVGKLPKEK